MIRGSFVEGLGTLQGKEEKGKHCRCLLPDLFDIVPPQLLRLLNSMSWECRPVTDRPGLASDLWHDLGRFIVPCYVAPSHLEKKRERERESL